MEVEIRLKKLLQQYNLDTFGVTQRIARDLKVHRHTIGKLYRSELTNPSLGVLGAVCEWLKSMGVPAESLPEALLGVKPSGLWQAITSEAETVAFFVAEHRQVESPGRTWRWVAQDDALVIAKIVQFLSSPRDMAERRLTITTEYVPLRVASENRGLEEKHSKNDIKRAKEIFETMRAIGQRRSSIVIGSQRVNHLVELMIADTFGCEPSCPPTNQTIKVPFYLAYRHDDRAVASCFGGRDAPPGCGDAVVPGIYYRDESGWVACPWTQDKEDAGIILVMRDPGTAALQMAVFGFSGRGTEAIGEQLLRTPDRFWSNLVSVNGKEVGAYVCRFTFGPPTSEDRDGEPRLKDVVIIPLDAAILTDDTDKAKRAGGRAAGRSHKGRHGLDTGRDASSRRGQ